MNLPSSENYAYSAEAVSKHEWQLRLALPVLNIMRSEAGEWTIALPTHIGTLIQTQLQRSGIDGECVFCTKCNGELMEVFGEECSGERT